MTIGSDKIKKLRHRRSRILKMASGDKCIICGYNRTWKALVFHHLDSSKKDFAISSYYLVNWNKVVKEAKKCILICCNCHIEIHDNLYSIKELKDYYKKMRWDDEILKEGNKRLFRREPITLKCPNCKKYFVSKDISQKYCSIDCSNFVRRKVKSRPPISKLQEEIKKSNFTKVGQKYGVSGNCIRKWLKLK